MKRGTIKLGRWRYALTDQDIVWAARMVQGETLRRARRDEDALSVLWTMTQLFSPAGQRDKYGSQRFGTFTDLIRAYSQPINPRWLPGGLFCQPGGRAARTDGCTAQKMRRRTLLQETPWLSLDPELRAVVLAWAKGRTRNPVPRATEFATAAVAARFVDRHRGARAVKRVHNTFVATATSRRWTTLPRIEAAAVEAEREAALPIGVALLSLGAGGLLAWGADRYVRRRRSQS